MKVLFAYCILLLIGKAALSQNLLANGGDRGDVGSVR
jgi:hypothetical protein